MSKLVKKSAGKNDVGDKPLRRRRSATNVDFDKSGLYQIDIKHRIYYNTKNPIPIKEIIIALQGLQGVLIAFPELLRGVSGVDIDGCEFLIQSIEAGSLSEHILIKVLFKNKENMDEFLERLGENKVVKTVIVSSLIGALVFYGINAVTSKSPTPNITANNNTIINIGAGEVSMTPEQFTAVVNAAVGDKRAAAEGALRFIAPAKADPGSGIEFGDGSVSINPRALAEAPSKIELQPNERMEEFSNVDLVIRAANMDSKKTGWAGRLGGRVDRLPIELDPSVSEAELFGKSSVRVDAAIIFKEAGRSRSLKASKIYLRRVLSQ